MTGRDVVVYLLGMLTLVLLAAGYAGTVFVRFLIAVTRSWYGGR